MIAPPLRTHTTFLAKSLRQVVNNIEHPASARVRAQLHKSFTGREAPFARNLLPASDRQEIMPLTSTASQSVMRFLAAFIAGALLLAQSPALCAEDILVSATFDRSPDAVAVERMQTETARVFSEAGLTFSWRPEHQFDIVPAGVRTVRLKVHGDCRIEPNALAPPEGGRMGWVESQDGEIRPSIDIDCDRISAMVWQNRGTLPLPLVARAFGRGLGRVLAHELYHYLTQSAAHTASEIFRHAMTSHDLMLPEVRFEPAEIDALRKAMSPPGGRSATE